MPWTRYIVAGVLISVIVAGALYCLVWWLRTRQRLIAPYRRFRSVPWTGPELTLVLLLYVGLPMLALAAADALRLIPPIVPDKPPTPHEIAMRLSFTLLVSPLILMSTIGLLWWHSRTKRRRLGLTPWRWRHALTLGYMSFVVVGPLVIGIQYTVSAAMKWLGAPVTEHPLVQMTAADSGSWIWIMLPIQAVIAAPIIEELVFRGVMQQWLARRWWGGWAAMAGAVAIGIAIALGSPDRSVPATGVGTTPITTPTSEAAVNVSRMPLVFALASCLLAILLTLRENREQSNRRAMAGTAILFAMVHANFWPSPIPLLILGLALSWSAHRSRNLIAPIVLHALFNSIATLMVLLGARS